MNKRLKIIFVILLLLVLTGMAIYNYQQQQKTAKTYTGTVEVTKVDITTKISGYMTDLSIKEGDMLHKGENIAKIDRPDFLSARKRDQAALKKSQAQLADLEKGARPEELREAAANTAAAKAAFIKSEKDYNRQQSLYVSGATAHQQLDDAEAAYDSSKAQLSAAQEKESLLLAGNRSDQILAAQDEIERCEAVLQESLTNINDMTISSPLDGLVLTKNFEMGEYLASGAAIATAADLTDCWIKIYVPSEELGKIRIGDEAIIKIDAAPDQKFHGTIKEIKDSAEYTPRQSITKNERTNMVFAVKIAVDNASSIFKPGMPADVILND